MKRLDRRLLALLLVFALLLACAGCSGTDRSSTQMEVNYAPEAGYWDGGDYADADEAYDDYEDLDYAVDEPMAEESYPVTGGGGEYSGGADLPSANELVKMEQKLIQNVNLTLQTLEFDAGVERIPDLVEEFGGFIASSSVEGHSLYNTGKSSRQAHFTLRIPAESVEDAVAVLGEEFHIIRKNQHIENVTREYYDIEARIRSLRAQESALLNMLEAPGAEFEHILEIRRELAYITYEIERYQTNLNALDGEVRYSTIQVSLQEVIEFSDLEPTPSSFGQSISRAFKQSGYAFKRFFQELTLSVIFLLPFLILLACIIFLIYKLRKRRRLAKADKLPNVHSLPEQESDPESPEKE